MIPYESVYNNSACCRKVWRITNWVCEVLLGIPKWYRLRIVIISAVVHKRVDQLTGSKVLIIENHDAAWDEHVKSRIDCIEKFWVGSGFSTGSRITGTGTINQVWDCFDTVSCFKGWILLEYLENHDSKITTTFRRCRESLYSSTVDEQSIHKREDGGVSNVGIQTVEFLKTKGYYGCILDVERLLRWRP